MSTIITNLQSLFSVVMACVEHTVECITAQPLLVLFILVPLVGIGVGMFKRLINVN